MTIWTYTSGHHLATNDAGLQLLAIPAAPVWAPLADLLNANPPLSQILLAGHEIHPG